MEMVGDTTTDYFTREIEYSCGDLTIYQATIGDVGHVVWDVAIVLSKFLDTAYFKKSKLLEGKCVVELGAGTGIVGLAAALFGANSYLTDLEELVPLMQKNIDENSKIVKGSVKALPLKWGDNCKSFLLEVSPEIILVADAIYYEESLYPLIETMRSLCGPHTVIYMSYEVRNTEHKVQLLKEFFEVARQHFDIEKIPLEEQDPDFRSEDIHILKMTKKSNG